jgi:hypothetical protein
LNPLGTPTSDRRYPETSGSPLENRSIETLLRELPVHVRDPLIAITGPDDQTSVFKSNQFHNAHIGLTETGRAVLAGEHDFVKRNCIDLWLGGVHLIDTSIWKWNEQESELIHVA